MHTWKTCMKWSEVKSLSRAWLVATPWTVACTKLLCPWDFLGKSTGVGCHFLLQESSRPRDRTQVSWIVDRRFTIWATRESDKGEVAQSCLTLCDPMDSNLHQAPQSMGFSRQEYWSGLPFPSPGNLPDPGIKPRSPTLSTDALPSEPPGKPWCYCWNIL